jgi:hypothetical protein
VDSGTERANIGDWIVRKPDGQFTVMSGNDFRRDYPINEAT